jgi:hypothetical protein
MPKASTRAIVPLLGALLSILAYLAQNVWGLFHIADLVTAIQSLDRGGLLIALGVIAAIEGTVLFCFYLPGIPLIILILLSLDLTWPDMLSIAASLMVGTMTGYAVSTTLGRVMQERLPPLVGGSSINRIRLVIERYGLLAVVPSAFHPNNLALTFAALGYFRARRLWLYFVTAMLAQAGWWMLYANLAHTVSRQNFITQSNFQLVLAILFLVWFLSEIIPARPVR